MNLLVDSWIPVRFKNGETACVSVLEIMSNNEIVELNTIRDDFNVSLKTFLIGLLQTVSNVQDDKSWRAVLKNGLDLNYLSQCFEEISASFEIGSNAKPAFMQYWFKDSKEFKDKLKKNKPKPKPIKGIVIGQPGESTEDKNQDLFIKRNAIECLCPACATQALINLQRFAGQGGSGIYSSLLRGGGMVTLVSYQDEQPLWKNLWLNVLPSSNDKASLSVQDLFPWMQNINKLDDLDYSDLSSIKDPRSYWILPRVVDLNFESNEKFLACDLCGKVPSELVAKFIGLTGKKLLPIQVPFAAYKDGKNGEEKIPIEVAEIYKSLGWVNLLQQYPKELRKDQIVPANVIHVTQIALPRTRFNINCSGFIYEDDKFFPKMWYRNNVVIYKFESQEQNELYLKINYFLVDFIINIAKVFYCSLSFIRLEDKKDNAKSSWKTYKISLTDCSNLYELIYHDYMSVLENSMNFILDNKVNVDFNEILANFYKRTKLKLLAIFEQQSMAKMEVSDHLSEIFNQVSIFKKALSSIKGQLFEKRA